MLMFKIGFLDFGWSDIVDVLLLAFLIYQLYRIVRGGLAYNIFFGILTVYILTLLAEAFNLTLISDVLGQFINIGVLGLLIVFQPEVRRFLLQLGKNSDLRKPGFWRRFNIRNYNPTRVENEEIDRLCNVLFEMATAHTGALLVIPRTSRLKFFVDSGVHLNADLSSDLLKSIFYKNNPLHDGAVIITQGKVLAAKCVLPVSESPDLPHQVGLRHRSAVGITEVSDALAIVVSEESATISIAKEGRLKLNIDRDTLREALLDAFFLV
jgi:diadenylate cyclase